MNVRPASPEDGDEMMALMPRLAAFDVPPSRDPRHLWMHDAALLQRWLAGKEPNCLVYVASEDSGPVKGIAMVTLREEMLSHAPSAHLEAIAVAEGLEGKGVGDRLLRAVEKAAVQRGALSMTLHVFAVNQRARAFYEKSGYDGELMRYTKPLADDH